MVSRQLYWSPFLGHIEGSKAQIAADGVGLKVVGRGGDRPLGSTAQYSRQDLVAHGRHLPGKVLVIFGHIGVTGAKLGTVLSGV